MSAPANPHFQTVASLAEAAPLLTFEPLTLRQTAGCEVQTIAVHVRDHKLRELAPAARSVETHYGAFVFAQSRHDAEEAARRVLETRYGPDPQAALVGGHPARIYPLGPEVPQDDMDGRMPAVVVWHDGELFYLIASDRLDALELARIAASLYP